MKKIGKQNTVTAKWYTEQCQPKVMESLKKLDQIQACTDFLTTVMLKLFEYSLNLVLCNFVKMKKDVP